MRSLIPVVVVVAAFSASFSTAPARAETSVTCAGFITALPATISTPGTWCLAGNLNTTLASGNAVTIATNGVTLDCNGFRVQATTPANTAVGVSANTMLNATVRNCTLRGFNYGIYFISGGSHLIENNLVDASLTFGIIGIGDGMLIRGNRVSNTGGTKSAAAGIYSGGGAVDVVDNIVDGVYPDPAVSSAVIGIITISGHGRIEENIVRDVRDPPMGTTSTAISVSGTGRMSVIGNDLIFSQASSLWYGLRCSGSPSTQVMMRNNTATGFEQPFVGCADGGDNLFYNPF